jgi:hypothetical protein
VSCRGVKKLAADSPKEMTKVRDSVPEGLLGPFALSGIGCLCLTQKGWHKSLEGVTRQVENVGSRLRVSKPSKLLADLLPAGKVWEKEATSMYHCIIQGRFRGSSLRFQSPVLCVPLAVSFTPTVSRLACSQWYDNIAASWKRPRKRSSELSPILLKHLTFLLPWFLYSPPLGYLCASFVLYLSVSVSAHWCTTARQVSRPLSRRQPRNSSRRCSTSPSDLPTSRFPS